MAAGGRARHSEGEERDDRSAYAGVVRDLRGDDSLILPLAEGLRVLRGFLGRTVGDPCGDVLTDAGNGADSYADETGADDRRYVPGDRLPFRQDFVQLVRLSRLDPVPEDLDDLWDAESPDKHRDDLDPALEIWHAEGETRIEMEGVPADHREEKPEKAHDPALDDQVGRGYRARDDDSEKGEKEELEGGELESEY